MLFKRGDEFGRARLHQPSRRIRLRLDHDANPIVHHTNLNIHAPEFGWVELQTSG